MPPSARHPSLWLFCHSPRVPPDRTPCASAARAEGAFFRDVLKADETPKPMVFYGQTVLAYAACHGLKNAVRLLVANHKLRCALAGWSKVQTPDEPPKRAPQTSPILASPRNEAPHAPGLLHVTGRL